MRKLVLVCCIGVMITGSAVAEQPANTAWAEKLFGDTTTKDFGTVAKGIQLKYSFKMTNIYAVPLTLSVRVSCDCVKATPSKNVLKPNESATLDINMDTRRHQRLQFENCLCHRWAAIHFHRQADRHGEHSTKRGADSGRD